MFDVDRFVVDCRDATAASGLPAVLDVVASVVSTPAEVLKGLGEPQRAGAQVLHRSPELTVFNLIWGPRMCQLPHNHGMWAVIGIYTGREDNIFWRRVPGAPGANRTARLRDLLRRWGKGWPGSRAIGVSTGNTSRAK